jgi:hypothetical protein
VIVRNDNHNTFEHVAATQARTRRGVSLDQGHQLANGARLNFPHQMVS